ncbi:MAG: hypothetical protein AVDCRST_MAG73-527, partial [uncultured Thermomicrobiales bacterium]
DRRHPIAGPVTRPIARLVRRMVGAGYRRRTPTDRRGRRIARQEHRRPHPRRGVSGRRSSHRDLDQRRGRDPGSPPAGRIGRLVAGDGAAHRGHLGRRDPGTRLVDRPRRRLATGDLPGGGGHQPVRQQRRVPDPRRNPFGEEGPAVGTRGRLRRGRAGAQRRRLRGGRSRDGADGAGVAGRPPPGVAAPARPPLRWRDGGLDSGRGADRWRPGAWRTGVRDGRPRLRPVRNRGVPDPQRPLRRRHRPPLRRLGGGDRRGLDRRAGDAGVLARIVQRCPPGERGRRHRPADPVVVRASDPACPDRAWPGSAGDRCRPDDRRPGRRPDRGRPLARPGRRRPHRPLRGRGAGPRRPVPPRDRRQPGAAGGRPRSDRAAGAQPRVEAAPARRHVARLRRPARPRLACHSARRRL